MNNDTVACVVNISYFPDSVRKLKKDEAAKLPKEFLLDLPQRIKDAAETNEYSNLVESFCYNTLSKKFQADVASCQIYLS